MLNNCINLGFRTMLLVDGGNYFPPSPPKEEAWIVIVRNFLDNYKGIFSIVLLVAGALMAIFLGVALAREEDPSKVPERRKRLIGLLCTIVLVLALVWVLYFALKQIPKLTQRIMTETAGTS